MEIASLHASNIRDIWTYSMPLQRDWNQISASIHCQCGEIETGCIHVFSTHYQVLRLMEAEYLHVFSIHHQVLRLMEVGCLHVFSTTRSWDWWRQGVYMYLDLTTRSWDWWRQCVYMYSALTTRSSGGGRCMHVHVVRGQREQINDRKWFLPVIIC